MACCLKPSLAGTEDFVGPVGSVVTMSLKAPVGVDAQILHLQYAGGELDSESPFEFTIARGPNFLVILVEASVPGALLDVVEDCGNGSEHVLRSFHFDPGAPARGLVIKGQ
jgi:hypothetical protein